MPSRLLREGILDSEPVNALTLPAEVFYRRLMSVVDDFGRFDGRPRYLKNRLYPIKDTVRESDISRWLIECEQVGLIALYAVDSKPYILFHKLGFPRAKDSKYPAPPADTKTPCNGQQPRSSESNGLHLKTDAPYSGSGTDSSADTGSMTPTESCSEPPKTAASEPALLTFPTVGKGSKEWHLTEPKLAEYRETFPGFDVLAELRKARQWCIDAGVKRKTAKGMPAFLTRWLSKAQNAGPRQPSANGFHAPKPAKQERLDELYGTIPDDEPEPL